MNGRIELRRRQLKSLMAEIGRPVTLMEVCGSHSHAVVKSGLRSLLPGGLTLLSGPGCPVCVSSASFIANAIELCRRNVKVAVFGDLLRVPSPAGTLGEEKGLLVIYSPEEALDYARNNPGQEVVLAAVGFEPTLAATAALLDEADEIKAANFSVLCDFKNLRPVLDLLAEDRSASLDGFLLPGHVAAVIGRHAFDGLALPGVVSGFTPENILDSIEFLLKLTANRRAESLNNYAPVVNESGNVEAVNLIKKYFEISDGEWRGLGTVKNGCWRIRRQFAGFNAYSRYGLSDIPAPFDNGCCCGAVLSGKMRPEKCPKFDKDCTPAHPVGACMVSSEGACSAAYYYREAKA